MPVPDDTVFGPKPNDGNQTYGEVREQNEQQRIQSLKLRLDDWLIAQTGHSVKAPFSLALLTCVAIECLGHVFLSPIGKSKDDGQRVFKDVMGKVDPRFNCPMEKGFLKALKQRWPRLEFRQGMYASDVVWKFFRTSMSHGYRARGVYLTGDETSAWKYADGYLKLNPFWLWKELQRVYEGLFNEALNEELRDNPSRKSSVRYIEDLLDG